MPDYRLLASPTLYPGQEVRAGVVADEGNSKEVACRLIVHAYVPDDLLHIHYGPEAVLKPGSAHEFEWRIGDAGGQPIASIGVDRGGGGERSRLPRLPDMERDSGGNADAADRRGNDVAGVGQRSRPL